MLAAPMFLKVGPHRDHGFDQPLGLLSDCHRRIELFLRVLSALADRGPGVTLSPAEAAQLDSALTYFAVAAPKHTADEEQSLFPRLHATHDPGAAQALDIVARLERDHEEADGHHAVVERLGRRWLADGVLAPEASRVLIERLQRLQALYSAHIRVEDRELFPAAARILSASALTEIGLEMAARRHVRAVAP